MTLLLCDTVERSSSVWDHTAIRSESCIRSRALAGGSFSWCTVGLLAFRSIPMHIRLFVLAHSRALAWCKETDVGHSIRALISY